MMQIIFLDLDGVLNNNYTARKQFEHFEIELVENINLFLERFDVNIVMSSSWRSDLNDAILQLEIAGFKYRERIIDITPFIGDRGLEIFEWINKNQFNGKFLVIDDKVEDVIRSGYIKKENCLNINPEIGLNVSALARLISYFNK